MKVKEIMTANSKACTTNTNLAEAASFMWDYDCGILPVVADKGRVVGLITDRDICIAGATKNRNLANISVEEIMTVMSTLALLKMTCKKRWRRCGNAKCGGLL